MTPTTAGIAQAGFLARRAGFGVPPDKLGQLSRKALGNLVTLYVDYDGIPDNSGIRPPGLNAKDDYANILELQQWWLARMIASPRQLEEKMTLFWHNLFATSNDKVSNAAFMYGQNQLFRKYAMGDFQTLLTAICIDPAMLIWLDGSYSFKDGPNENFGREVMELFTLGVGNYTQDDVVAGARAFTGWYIDDNNVLKYSPSDHDSDPKTFLGYTGRFDYKDIARILANHPACGRFLAKKLWTFFAYSPPEPAIIDELAKVYRTRRRSIREVVRHMFSMPAFYNARALTGRVKGPTEYAVTAVRELGATVTMSDLNDYIYPMGQSLFYPPNVGGWATGTRWINTATVVARVNFAEWILEQHANPLENRVNMTKLMRFYTAKTWDGVLTNIARFHLSPQITPQTWDSLRQFTAGQPLKDSSTPGTLEAALQLAMVSPEYHCA